MAISIVLFFCMFIQWFVFNEEYLLPVYVNTHCSMLSKMSFLCLALKILCIESFCNLVKLMVGRITKVGVTLFLVLLLCSVVVVSGYTVFLVNAQDSTVSLMSDESYVPQQPHFPQQTGSTITIASDGSVVGTDKIQYQGNVYTLTGDIFELIKIDKRGITIDGDGYAIKGIGNGINLKNDDSQGCGDIVVKNVRFCEGSSIFATSNGHSFINNRFEGGRIDISGGIKADGKGNIIKHNVFVDCHTAIRIIYSNLEVVSENDFIVNEFI